MRLKRLSTLLVGLLVAMTSSASASLERLPNLQVQPARDLHLDQRQGKTFLKFSATSFNNGNGPVELRAGEVNRRQKKQKVHQCVYQESASNCDYVVGEFVWHAGHNHFHFENFMIYELFEVVGGQTHGAAKRSSSKTSFCVMDFERYGSTAPPVYTTCNDQVQGMSVGWADTYGYWLAGQEIDVTRLPNGTYRLRLTVNPQGKLRETNTGDNYSDVTFQLQDGTIVPA